MLIIPALFCEAENLLSFSTIPYGMISLGSSTELFNLGAGVRASASFISAVLRYFGFTVGAEFLLLPIELANSIWALSDSADPVFRLSLGERLALHTGGRVGYYYWIPAGWEAGEINGGGFTFGGGVGTSF